MPEGVWLGGCLCDRFWTMCALAHPYAECCRFGALLGIDTLAAVRFPPTHKAKFLALVTASMASATIGLSANPAKALFIGDYDTANWTQTIQGDGSINTTGAPNSISLTSSNSGTENIQNTDFTIAAASAGTVSFDWSFSTNDGGSRYDPFGYLLNGSFTQLTDDDGSRNQAGSASFSVLSGDVFGFRQNTVDGVYGAATTTVSNFNAPAAAVPAPLPILGLPAVLFYSRKLKKRIKASRELLSR